MHDMKKNDKLELLEKKIDGLLTTMKNITYRTYVSDLLSRYKLKSYVVKKHAEGIVLEDTEKTGWYVDIFENRIDVYEEGLLKRRIGSDYECAWSYWPNRESHIEVCKDLATCSIDKCKMYTEKGELSDTTQITRDESDDIVKEYVQTFWHTEKKVDKKNGKLIKTTEFWNDLIDKNETVYKVTVVNENSTVLYERISTVDDEVRVKYGEHEKLGNVVARIENFDFNIQPVYDEEGICVWIVVDKRVVGNPKKWIYLKETCRDRAVMTDWEKVIEYVKKKKYKNVKLKKHWYDFEDKKFTEKAEEILKRSVVIEIVDLEKVEFVKGTIV